MRRGLDFDKAEAALRRAAEKATHGTREERSGRFGELYVERRSRGDYVVRRGSSERASATAPTQKEAIAKAGKLGLKATILVERVRNSKVGDRDKGRKA